MSDGSRSQRAFLGQLAFLAVLFLCDPQGAWARDQKQSGEIAIWAPLEPGGKKVIRPDWAAIKSNPLGSNKNPVRVFMPRGEHAYLARLTCKDGSKPKDVSRVGSFSGSPYGTLVDGYSLFCGSTRHMLFLDMYHPGYVETRAPAGFRITQAGSGI